MEAVGCVAEGAIFGAVEDVQLVELEPDANALRVGRQLLPDLSAQPDVARSDLERHAAELLPLLRQAGERVPAVAVDPRGQLLVRGRLQVEVEDVAWHRRGRQNRRRRNLLRWSVCP